MSHARSRREEGVAANRPFLELTRMVNQGRSWSGHERNCAFLNTGGGVETGRGRFADISASSGFDFPDDGRAVALTDWDQDGDLDVWVSNRNAPRLRLLLNSARGTRGGGGGRFLAVRLEGDGRRTNRDAIGARVEVTVAGPGAARLERTLRAGEGFLAQSSKWLHFGLGEADRVERIRVHWPGNVPRGAVEEFRGLEPDRRYHLVQGTGRAREVSPRRPVDLRPGEPVLPPQGGPARIPLVTLVALPPLEYEGPGGRPLPLPAGRGRALLLNLWASWCAPCREELAEIARREGDLRARGVEVLALSVDGLGDDRGDPAAARGLLESLRFPFPSGRATPGLLQVLQYFHDGLLSLHRPLPVPTSVLVDPEGRLAVIYKGRLSVDEALADLDHSRGSRLERWRRAAALPGRALEHELAERVARTAETGDRFQLALALERAGRTSEAAREYRQVLLLQPDLAEAHYNLGILCEKEGKREEARALYLEALRIKPGYPGAHNTLGLLLAKQGRRAEARAEFEAEIRLHPRSADAHNHLGILHLEAGEVAPAEALFRKTLDFNPDLADARNNLGLALRRLGRLEEAAREYRHAIRLQPAFAEAHNNLGALLLHQRKPAEAREHFRRALELRPDFTAARNNLERANSPPPGGTR